MPNDPPYKHFYDGAPGNKPGRNIKDESSADDESTPPAKQYNWKDIKDVRNEPPREATKAIDGFEGKDLGDMKGNSEPTEENDDDE